MDNISTYNHPASCLIPPKQIKCDTKQKKEEYLVAKIVNGCAHVFEVPYTSYNLYHREKVVHMQLEFE
jgi:hypothetical protein